MINCIAIDDEPIALSIISEYCLRRGNINLRCFTSPVEGMVRIRIERPDVVFMDIEMTSHNGLELAKDLPEGTVLILTTAYSQYALEGFNVNALDFLHKPIFYPRFEQALEKVETWLRGNQPSTETEEQHSGDLTLKSGHRNIVVSYDSILLIEAMDNYVKVFRSNMSTVVSQITMKEMESKLPGNQFVRVHRSYIVPLAHIDSFTNKNIRIHGQDLAVPIGRTYNEYFMSRYRKSTITKYGKG